MLRKLVILGAGGMGREVLDIITDGGGKVAGFIVDKEYGNPGDLVNGHPILGDFDWLEGKASKVYAVPAVGTPELRKIMVEKVRQYGVDFTSVAHPSCNISTWASVGAGVVISNNTTIRPQSIISDFVQVNNNCTVSHDAVIEQYVTLSPGVMVLGYVTIKEGAFIGGSATFLPGVTVGEWSKVGLGAVVINNVPPNATAVGIPAKIVKERLAGWQDRIEFTISSQA